MTVSVEALDAISTPDRVESRLGPLDFVDGFPSRATSELVYGHLDFTHALNVFLNGFAGASTYALRKGFAKAGAKDNEILMFSELLGSESLFLTANADTVYFIGIVDLSSGPMVVETPPQSLGIFDDMWWRWIIDFGLPGPDRGEGGRFLLVGPGYDGSLPDSGYHVGHSPTTKAFCLEAGDHRGGERRIGEGADGEPDEARCDREIPVHRRTALRTEVVGRALAVAGAELGGLPLAAGKCPRRRSPLDRHVLLREPRLHRDHAPRPSLALIALAQRYALRVGSFVDGGELSAVAGRRAGGHRPSPVGWG
jgi:hypothetical protein